VCLLQFELNINLLEGEIGAGRLVPHASGLQRIKPRLVRSFRSTEFQNRCILSIPDFVTTPRPYLTMLYVREVTKNPLNNFINFSETYAKV
jgi:hypothetical protein